MGIQRSHYLLILFIEIKKNYVKKINKNYESCMLSISDFFNVIIFIILGDMNSTSAYTYIHEQIPMHMSVRFLSY